MWVNKKRHVCWTLVVCLLATGVIATLWYYICLYKQPFPVRVLHSNYSEINEYALRVESDEIPLREDGQGYYLLDRLYKNGVRYVRKEHEMVIITFGSMPPDATEKLVYVPDRKCFDIERAVGTKKVHCILHVDDHWVYILVD